MWYQKLDTYMLGIGFTRRKEDDCLYFKLIGDHLIYLVLYVDDMLLIGKNKEIIVRDLAPHVDRIIYFHVIKFNINKAYQ
jgi:hypothetical protein